MASDQSDKRDEVTSEASETRKLVRCPSCRAEIENDDVAHFDMHREYEDRLRALEERGATSNPEPNGGPRVRFDFNPFPEEDRGPQDDQAEARAAE